MKSHTKYGLVIGLVTLVLICGLALAASAKGRPHEEVTVYVISQGLLYDSIVLADLPNKGPFQQLFPLGSNEEECDVLCTEFGPGDPGYLGGRWWVDADGDGVREDTDVFFLCPLLPPGY